MNLTTENTAIVLDSTADFPDAQIRFPNMRVVPLYVRFGEESFRDYVELDPHDFYRGCAPPRSCPPPRSRRRRTSSRPTTRSRGYERIYSLHISSKLSGTFQSASLAAAEDGGDRIRLVDTESASVGIGMLALAIQELLARGTTDEEIEALAARHRERAGILFTVDTLEFLAKGGRIGRGRALMGSLLNVKPILAIEDGEVVPVGRVRGRAKAFEEFRKRFEEATTDGPGLGVAIAHAEAEEAVEQLREIVLANRPQAEVKLVTQPGRGRRHARRSRHRRLLLVPGMTHRFATTLQPSGTGGGFLAEIPLDVPALFGGKRVPVRGSVNGTPFRTTIAVYGGRYYLGFRKEIRDAAGISAGDELAIELERDDEPRTVDVPADFAAALGPEERAFLDSLAFTHRREYVEWIEDAKREETRQSRIAKAVEMLRRGGRTPR